MTTALQAGLCRAEEIITSDERASHIIPPMEDPMEDPMGSGWSQPARHLITVDDRCALMTMATFESLAEYSTTTPSGVYSGKMWRCRSPWNRSEWLLRWFGECAKPECPGPACGNYVSNHSRVIILSDGELPA